MDYSISQPSEIFANKFINSLRCPLCLNIPKINLLYKDNKVEIKSMCPKNHIIQIGLEEFLNKSKRINFSNALCSNCNTNLDINGEFCYECDKIFCYDCAELNHINHHKISLDFYDYYCIEHFQPYNSYCENCQKNICSGCKEYHSNNHIIQSFNQFQFDFQKIEKKLQENKIFIGKVYEIKEKTIQSINALINNVNKSYYKFKEINDLENELIRTIINSYKININQLNYQIIYNYNKNINCDPNNIKDLYQEIENETNEINILKRINNFYLNVSNFNKKEILKDSFMSNTKINRKYEDTYTNNEKDNQTINSNSNNKIITVIGNKPSENYIKIIETHPIICIIELKKKYITLGLDNGLIKIYNKNNNNNYEKIISINEHQKQISCLLELKSGILASGSFDQNIKLFEINFISNSFKILSNLTHHQSPIKEIYQLYNEDLVSFSENNTLIFWNKTQYHSKGYSEKIILYNQSGIFNIIQLKNQKIILNKKNQVCFNRYHDIKFEEHKKIKIENPYINNEVIYELNDNNFIIGEKKGLLIFNGIKEKFNNYIQFNKEVTNLIYLNHISSFNLLICFGKDIAQVYINDELMIEKTKYHSQCHKEKITGILLLNDQKIATIRYDKRVKIW